MIDSLRRGAFAWLLEDRGFTFDAERDEWVLVSDGVKTIVSVKQEWVGR